jgi:hypothetical protein
MGGHTRLLAVLVLALALAGCWFGGSGGSQIKLPPLTPFDDALAAQLRAIAVRAADVRELTVNEDIEQGTVTRDQLTAYYRQSATDISDDDKASLETINTAMRLLGMIGPDDDLLDIVTNYYGGQTLGFYDHEEKKMVLVRDAPTELSAGDEMVLAHEFVHSFQDGRFDLTKLRKRSDDEDSKRANTEYGDTIDALIEGDANYAAGLYVLDKFGASGFDEIANEPDTSPDQGPPVPPAIERYFSFPYDFGASFVRFLHDRGGWAEVDKAFADPPQTEEQIMHPDKYVQGEKAVDLVSADYSKDLGKGWSEEEDGVFGEYDVNNWVLTSLGDSRTASLAAAGWGGGRIRVYSNGKQPGHVLLELSLVWDDTDEARQFYAAFVDMVKRIDPTPGLPDPSAQIISWQSAQQAGQAWIQGKSFAMVVAAHPEDIAPALPVFQAPDHIASADDIIP